ncbi:sensor histidine kinase [Mediterraneibacter sp.]|jgi:two-component system sensor histidine kinase CiaH|uniref:sensor histidine kinase n=1 Tax=Mediterraneibacter sp. TaxID=2316022 RepID=UPI0027BAB575|nr:HAMP domain-containing sensor histidine kinase [Mediterraneibacter sp.]
MIRKLRIKLVTASMVSLLFVLLVIESIVIGLNYGKIIKDSDHILDILAENAGDFPQKPPDDKKKEKSIFSPELPYETRYFSVLMNKEGNIIFTDTGKIASIHAVDAAGYAQRALEKQYERGFADHYRYLISDSGSEIRIIFLDCRRQLDLFHNLFMTGFGVTAVGLLAVFVLMVYLSARIVKPFSDNYEKQKRFITDAGHELKTPLTIIDADTEILEMDFGENEWLKDIRSQTNRLADLTNSLVVLSRMEEGGKSELTVEFPLSDLVEEVVGEFQAPAKIQKVTLTCSVEPMISMNGDEKAIRELLMLLLDNAVKYTNQNGRISVTLKRQNKRIYFSVFNTTESISKEQIPYLFDRFYRTDNSRNSQTGGYGLGLSIAAAIAENHKGKITAETKDEKSLKIMVVFNN